MAKAKKLNTDLDDSAPKKRKSQPKEIDESYTEPTETMGASDEVTYNMGDIQVSESDTVESEAEDFKKATQKITADNAEDEEDDWVDEDVNSKDEDIFLDLDQDFDPENPYTDEDY